MLKSEFVDIYFCLHQHDISISRILGLPRFLDSSIFHFYFPILPLCLPLGTPLRKFFGGGGLPFLSLIFSASSANGYFFANGFFPRQRLLLRLPSSSCLQKKKKKILREASPFVAGAFFNFFILHLKQLVFSTASLYFTSAFYS